MSVIAEMTIPSDDFELGQILRVEPPTRIALETMVPLDGRPVPFVRLKNDARETFEQSVGTHESVTHIHVVNTHDDETLYALEWTPSDGSFVATLIDMDVVLLSATGNTDRWRFELRFPTHDMLSMFHEYHVEADLSVTITRIYNPTKPDAGPWYGLTLAQRETLIYAVDNGYYALPRDISTKEIATQFDISDQAVTERLRRGITALVTNTLLASAENR